MNLRQLTGPIVCGLALTALAAGEAQASKEKFTRTKPHVNVGAIGSVDRLSQEISVTFSLLDLDDLEPQARRDRKRCSGVFDLRVLEAANLSGPPLAERANIALETNETYHADLQLGGSSAGPVPVYVVLTARDMRNVDGEVCVFRGVAEVRSTDGSCAARRLPFRPGDFVVLGGPDER